MTNDEYQDRERERRRREESEAAFRKSQDDYARSQREQQARAAEESRKSYSRTLGRSGGMPSPFGPGVDLRSYWQGKQEHDAHKRFMEALKPQVRPSRPAPLPAAHAASARSGSKSGGGKVILVLALVIGILYLIGSHKDSLSSEGSGTASAPVTAAGGDGTPVPGTDTASNSAPGPDSTAARQADPPAADSGTAALPPAPSNDTQQPHSAASTPIAGGQPVSASPADNVGGAQPPPSATPVPDVPADSPYAAWPAEGVRYAASHKGGDGCTGDLLLTVSALEFTCPGDAWKSFSLGLTQVQQTDKDGIRLFSGKKYHFKISGEAKEQTENVFAQWLTRARVSPTAQTTSR